MSLFSLILISSLNIYYVILSFVFISSDNKTNRIYDTYFINTQRRFKTNTQKEIKKITS